jgi:hypothetical protein
MLFTNDLDTTRGQSFRETHGELLELMSEAGFAWTAETLHAGESELRLVAKSACQNVGGSAEAQIVESSCAAPDIPDAATSHRGALQRQL